MDNLDNEIIEALSQYIVGTKKFVINYNKVSNGKITFHNHEIRSTCWMIRVHISNESLHYLDPHGRKMTLTQAIEYVLLKEKMQCSGW